MRILFQVVVILCFLPSLSFAADVVGNVTGVQGDVIVRRGGKGVVTSVKGGDNVLFLDFYRTGGQSRLKMLFEDDSLLSIGEKSQIHITENVYNPEDRKRTFSAKLLTGRMKALVGKIFSGPDAKFEIATPTAVASARGTAFIIWLTDIDGTPTTGVVSLEGGVIAKSLDPGVSGEVLIAEKFHTMVKKGFPPSEPSPIPSDLLAELSQATAVATQGGDVAGTVDRDGQVDGKGVALPGIVSLTGGGISRPSAMLPIDIETPLVNTTLTVEVQFP